MIAEDRKDNAETQRTLSFAEQERIHHRGHRAHREDWGWESDGDGGLGTWKALGMKRSTLRVMRSGQVVDS